ncbi:putative ABC transporter ATP-binding protein YxlF [Micromonospora sp. MW-13]|uniref:ABC transporter ATP-binding protein n=1 Tax=unclassified Micromonospora TaxID=2617518 RepID=UPI000E445A01|nr:MULTISPECIES: ATP-binding cassette domain-containing protein [unclassified Micromonospora]MCX4473033.1 ATP-binding cassette domain-containing protein [Micromonospora sp. NBC_01655]RGC65250.1 putative ABC transporter ATP-binding protein YxlF [Micromonospora sp. MW-13]
MIQIDGLSKRHGSRTVLSDVSFHALPGRVTGFLGPNGAGKSSTLRILLGLDRPTAGSALIGGRPYPSLRTPLRTVGSMLDGSGAHRSRTARGHLGWVARSNGIPKHRVGYVLEQVGLAGAARTRVGRFSLGMGQRLGLAAALLGEPEALVLDEPVNGLDPEGIRWIRTLLRGHTDAGGTVLLSSHLMSEVAAIADDLVVISGGQVVAAGPVAHVTAGYATLEDAFFGLTGGPGAGEER